jgi:integrase
MRRSRPVVLSAEKIVRLLEAAPGPKYKAAFSAAYGAGLRVSEVVALKVSDVDSKRMLLRPNRARGRKIVLRCSRRSCSNSYAIGIALRGQRCGCFQAVIGCCR